MIELKTFSLLSLFEKMNLLTEIKKLFIFFLKIIIYLALFLHLVYSDEYIVGVHKYFSDISFEIVIFHASITVSTVASI